MSAPSPAAPGHPPAPIDHANVVSLLGTTRTLARIWILLGILVGLLSLVAIVLSALAFHFIGGGIGGLVYAILWVAIDLLLVERIQRWSGPLAEGRFQSLKEPLLLWGILGTLFGVVPGLLLLWIYVKVLPWPDLPGPGPNPPVAAPAVPAGAVNPPPASEPRNP